MGERIAIVGYDAYLPAGRTRAEIDAFLTAGVTAIREVPREEMLEAGVHEAEFSHPDYIARSARAPWTPGTARHLAGVTPQELKIVDPQHLLFLECCIGALYDAGLDPKGIAGKEIAVIGGIGMGLYAGKSLDSHFNVNLRDDQDLRERTVFPELLIGNSGDHCVGRVSYRLGLIGPSVNVQTACSTAFTAIEHAVLLLRSGRVDTALAGAAALYFPDRRGYQWERGGILSPTGTCRAYDAAADGTVGGSGAGVFVLRRYEDAVADGNVIHGVIEGVFSASDGAQRASYAAPAFDGQVRVIQGAMADAGVDPEGIDYVEGHGTGTRLGDLIELGALNEVFGKRDAPLPVGSIKPALGHLDTAAGIAGLVNVLLGLRRGWMPPTANFTALPDDARGWIARPSSTSAAVLSDSARVGISCFGASGTSVHMIVTREGATPIFANKATSVSERKSSTAHAAEQIGAAEAANTTDRETDPRHSAPEIGTSAGAPSRVDIVDFLIDEFRQRGDFGHLTDDDLVEVGLLDFAIDSVALTAITNRMQSRWGVSLSVIDLLAAVTVHEIADLVESELAT